MHAAIERRCLIFASGLCYPRSAAGRSVRTGACNRRVGFSTLGRTGRRSDAGLTGLRPACVRSLAGLSTRVGPPTRLCGAVDLAHGFGMKSISLAGIDRPVDQDSEASPRNTRSHACSRRDWSRRNSLQSIARNLRGGVRHVQDKSLPFSRPGTLTDAMPKSGLKTFQDRSLSRARRASR